MLMRCFSLLYICIYIYIFLILRIHNMSLCTSVGTRTPSWLPLFWLITSGSLATVLWFHYRSLSSCKLCIMFTLKHFREMPSRNTPLQQNSERHRLYCVLHNLNGFVLVCLLRALDWLFSLIHIAVCVCHHILTFCLVPPCCDDCELDDEVLIEGRCPDSTGVNRNHAQWMLRICPTGREAVHATSCSGLVQSVVLSLHPYVFLPLCFNKGQRHRVLGCGLDWIGFIRLTTTLAGGCCSCVCGNEQVFVKGVTCIDQLRDCQLVKKELFHGRTCKLPYINPAFYGTRRFITAFTTARHLSLSWVRSIQ